MFGNFERQISAFQAVDYLYRWKITVSADVIGERVHIGQAHYDSHLFTKNTNGLTQHTFIVSVTKISIGYEPMEVQTTF